MLTIVGAKDGAAQVVGQWVEQWVEQCEDPLTEKVQRRVRWDCTMISVDSKDLIQRAAV